MVVRGEPCGVETIAETCVRCVASLAVLSEMWSPASLVLAAVVEVWTSIGAVATVKVYAPLDSNKSVIDPQPQL